MILEALITLFLNFLLALLDTLNLVSAPVDIIVALREFAVYGSYIVGSDLLVLFGTMVFLWAIAKLSVGLAIRIWELLPLT
jgi:hypothetical protein